MSLEPLAGCIVVDLYAGSGAMGIEALSRGASHAHFVERGRAALGALETNLETLELHDRSTVWTLDLERGMKPLLKVLVGADVVLMDPPYGKGAAALALARLGEPGVLRSGACVVAEHHGKDPMPETSGDLVRTRARRYGETVVSLYRNASVRDRRV